MLRNRSTATAAPKTAPFSPLASGAAQLIPDFRGAKTGYRSSRWRLWLPDNVPMPDGSTWRYSFKANYPVLRFRGGAASTPQGNENDTLPTIKAAITAGQIPPCIAIYPDMRDPAPYAGTAETWGMNCANGTYPYEDVIQYDMPELLRARCRTLARPEDFADVGFSAGGMQVLRSRAKFDTKGAKVHVVLGAPRLDADLGGAGAAYNNWTAAEKTKIFNDSQQWCQRQIPISSSAGIGLFNTVGAGIAPLLMLESDPGDATAANSMNNAINTRLPALSVAFTTVNLDNAGHTPTHNLALYMAAWVAEETNHLGWMVTNGWGT